MKTAKTIQSVRDEVTAARKKGKTIGLVPTMGALHVGHISLIAQAKKRTDFVVVSIFVNPTQFGPSEDFKNYPRPVNDDLNICQKNGVDIVFHPSVEQMYPHQNLTWVNVEKITDPLCGRLRPNHFRGVATVCTKLFNIVAPDIAFFGQKDAQQAAVIKQIVADLNMPLEIVICPTIREPDGLAISSRNKYLNPDQRGQAPALYKALRKCQQMIDDNITDTENITTEMRKILEESPDIKLEYICITDAQTLEPCLNIKGKVLIAVAARLGPARLIDNILIDTNKK